jgi:nicotinamidase-related amidase
MKKASSLIIIDLQKYFRDLDPEGFSRKLLPNTARVLKTARSGGMPIIHLITLYKPDKSDWPSAWSLSDNIWCMEGTEGADILEEVAPIEGELVVVKKRFSGFYQSELDNVLRSHNIETLFIAGYASDGCVRFTTVDAYNRNYNLNLLVDCVLAAWEDTGASIQYLKKLTNLNLVSVDGFIRAIKGADDHEQL